MKYLQVTHLRKLALQVQPAKGKLMFNNVRATIEQDI